MQKQTQLTKEYFEKHLDKSFKRFRVDITKDLKDHVSKEIGDLAAMTARGFRTVDARFDKTDAKIDKLVSIAENHEKRIQRVEKAVCIPETV